jgi:predicted HicB family RNase H-like nuclease
MEKKKQSEKMITVRVSPETRAKLKSICALQQTTVNDCLRAYIDRVIKSGKIS